MFWKKKPDTEYMFHHFQRTLPLYEKWSQEREEEYTNNDLLHEYEFMLTFFTAIANNTLGVKPDKVTKFVMMAITEIAKRVNNFDLNKFEYNINACADYLRASEMYFVDTARTFYDNIVLTDKNHRLSKKAFVEIVSSSSAGLLATLQRDGFLR